MKIKYNHFFSILYLPLLLFISLLNGCTIGIVKPEDPNDFYANAEFVDFTKPNPRLKITKQTEKSISITINEDFQINSDKDISKAKYNNFYFNLLNMLVVKDQIFNGNKYNYLIDTGFNYFALTNSIALKENNLTILPAGNVMENNIIGGYCFLNDFKFGNSYVDCLPSSFILQHWEVNAAGIPLWQQKGFLIGNKLLRKYSYLHFDNPNKEMSFSVHKDFVPCTKLNWSQYPLILTDDNILRVIIPVGSQKLEIMFDTCGHHGIVLDQQVWDKIKLELEILKEKKSTFLSGFLGRKPCRKIKVERLKLGNQTITKPEIIVQDNTDKAFHEGYISIKYFKRSNLVLDFKNKLFWIGSNKKNL